MTANPYRGEVSLDLAGRSYTLRPSFAAMVEIEQVTGRGLVPVARSLLGGEVSVQDVAAVLTAGINAARAPGTRAVTLSEIGQAVFEAGILTVVPTTVEFLTGCLNGGSEPDPKQ